MERLRTKPVRLPRLPARAMQTPLLGRHLHHRSQHLTLPRFSSKSSLNSRPTLSFADSDIRRPFSMTSPSSRDRLQHAFNPGVYERIREFWFEKAGNDHELILPPMDLAKQWFTSDPDFDKVCRDTFGEQLRLMQSGTVTASDLLNTTASLKPLDWLGLILLLDQIPRNCYRGSEAKVAFDVFDPIAIAVTLRAIEQGIPDAPEIRYHAGYRLWFYLPLQHSEKLEIHELSMKEHARIFTDMKDLMASPEEDVVGDAKLKQCRKFLLENREAVDKWEDMLVGFARRHMTVIDRFGRYPHRNQALGRESTAEEAKYLAEGGETFSSGK
ncbi:hypothetical protein QBC34DRAFT_417648 [Podospora aff. communis PSN243]|uniref:DUF924-domain-containing protein n=1 Tax=Podospora aff. communis PSN243 TaxID=3040156 RepID=A0AAV9G472_9PEZI|nr:hypothetical protein QBC34DRAFT_417648 [Podospora aff. communis PSN243]